MFARALFLLCIVCGACKDHASETDKPAAAAGKAMMPHPTFSVEGADPALDVEREEYIQDAMAFTKLDHATVLSRLDVDNPWLREEWNAWEKQGAMTEQRMEQFYKQTLSYIWDLGAWHLYNLDKRKSDLAMVKQMQDLKAKNVLDFGGGVGLNSMMMARAGIDVTLADLDSKTLEFAKFRAERHGVKMKFWKTDAEPMPPDAKYDVILALDVFEHLPKNVLHDTVDKLIKLKTPNTQVIINAPFGRTAGHPMHLDETEDTKQQIERVKTALPPS